MEAILAVAGVGVYADFFALTVPTPLGLLFALGLLPTGDLLRWVTGVIDRRVPRRATVNRNQKD